MSSSALTGRRDVEKVAEEAIQLAHRVLQKLEENENEARSFKKIGKQLVSKILDKTKTEKKQQILDCLEDELHFVLRRANAGDDAYQSYGSTLYNRSGDIHRQTVLAIYEAVNKACTEFLNLENGKASNPVFAELNRINARLEVIYQEAKVVEFGVKDSGSVTKRSCCVIV